MTTPPEQPHDHLQLILAAHRADREPFRWRNRYISTGFSTRLLPLLEYAMETSRWLVVCARSGDGKSTTLRHFQTKHPFRRGADGVLRGTVIATRVPVGRASADALLVALAEQLGAVPNLRLARLRQSVVMSIDRAGIRLIVIDDAHELSLAQLNYLRELTDMLKDLRRDSGTEVGLILLAVAETDDPADQPLWRLIARSKLSTEQFNNRLDGTSPLIMVESLSRAELGRVLATYQRLYSDLFPALRLTPWTRSVFDWLTDKRIEKANTGRVRMRSVRRLLEAVLAEAWARELPGLDAEGRMLYDTAVRLAVRGIAYSSLADHVESPREATK
jgi:hypothetical protein